MCDSLVWKHTHSPVCMESCLVEDVALEIHSVSYLKMRETLEFMRTCGILKI